ncbi:hypothetical protein CEK29_16230 [Bordetella genomosp. 5]|nr:hypothetical protein CEK29_16230 [Bordetella genomosp. 5]
MAALDGYTLREALNGEAIAEILAPQGMDITVTLRIGSTNTTLTVTGAGNQPVPVVVPGSAFATAGAGSTAIIVAQQPSGERIGSGSVTLDMTGPSGGATTFQLDGTAHPLTLKDLGLSVQQLLDHAGGKVVIVKAENLTVYRNGTAVTEFTLEDLLAGLLQIQHSQPAGQQTLSGPSGAMSWKLEGPAGSTVTPIEGHFNFANGTGGAIIWGDGSGAGGTGYKWTSVAPDNGTNGGGGDDFIVGTTGGDLIFGDRSGGGAGGGFYASGIPGKGGSGKDWIYAGDGDDLIFGDGFDGGRGLSRNGGVGGYGGGGGGSGSNAGGAGGLGGNAGAGAGGTPGAGANNGGLGNYVTDRDGNGDVGWASTGTVATVVSDARSQFLWASSDMFRQDMGNGDDYIHGGNGNDYIMAGKGNDTILGGRGNDIMYGGAGVGRAAGESNRFVWEQGDAGNGAIDVIRDFSAWNGTSGDKLDISKLLENFHAATDDISHWIRTAVATTPSGQGWDAGRQGLLITIDIDGFGTGTVTQQIFLSNVTDSSLTAAALIASGALVI